jgi:hypothetical protein
MRLSTFHTYGKILTFTLVSGALSCLSKKKLDEIEVSRKNTPKDSFKVNGPIKLLTLGYIAKIFTGSPEEAIEVLKNSKKLQTDYNSMMGRDPDSPLVVDEVATVRLLIWMFMVEIDYNRIKTKELFHYPVFDYKPEAKKLLEELAANQGVPVDLSKPLDEQGANILQKLADKVMTFYSKANTVSNENKQR